MTSAGRPNLDRDYDLRAAFPDYVVYFEDWRSRSERARSELPCRLEVAYGPAARERLDIFQAGHVAGHPGPLLAFIHGGYWRSMDKSDFSFLAPPFVERGISLALINYSLFPGTTMSSLVAQIRRSCTWLGRNAERLGVPFDQLHLAGWSAGAHLAAMTACAEASAANSGLPPIASLIAVSGVYDLRPILHTSANSDLRLVGAEAARNSPIDHSPPTKPCPIAVVWGGNETDAFRGQSATFAAAWRTKGANVYDLEMPGLHHYAAVDALADQRSALFRLAREFISTPIENRPA